MLAATENHARNRCGPGAPSRSIPDLSALQLRGWTSISCTVVGNCQALEKNVTRPFRHTNEQRARSNLVGARPEELVQTLLELP
jgi:hypothetical protein